MKILNKPAIKLEIAAIITAILINLFIKFFLLINNLLSLKLYKLK
jgi:hypothetical protein